MAYCILGKHHGVLLCLNIISPISQGIRKELGVRKLPSDSCGMHLFLLGPTHKEVNMICKLHLRDASQRNNESMQKQIVSFLNFWKSAWNWRTATMATYLYHYHCDERATCQALCQVLHFYYPLTFTTALWGRSCSPYFTDDIHGDKYPAQSDRRWWTWNSNPGPFNSKAWATTSSWQAQGDRRNAASAATIRNKTDKTLLSPQEWEKGLGYPLVYTILLLKERRVMN